MVKKLFSRLEKICNNSLFKNNQKTNKIILLEFHGWKVLHIIQGIISNILAKSNFSKIIGYSLIHNFENPKPNVKLLENFKWIVGNIFWIKTFGIYKKMNVNKIHKFTYSSYDLNKSKKFINKLYIKKIDKKKILNLHIGKVYVGDLVYDSYLKMYNLPTIDTKDVHFINFLERFIAVFYCVQNFIKKKNISNVICSHATYLEGLPLRIASYKKIKCFLVTIEKIYQITKINPYANKEYLNFRKTFSKLNKNNKSKAVNLAKKKLKIRLQGKLGDMLYLTKTSYGKIKKKRVLSNNKKKKILIAAHSFCDAPHARGKGLFNDFYEWIIFLFELSENSQFDWYIKCHPNYYEYFDNTVKNLKELLKKYKNVKWIDPQTSNSQIIKEGINLALTVDGSIGIEYPYFNIPVINASKNNAHINYKFNYHPKNLSEYKDKIINFYKLKNKIKHNEIFECYFMNFLYFKNNWFFSSFDEVIKYHGGNFTNLYKSKKIYKYLNDNFNDNKLTVIVNAFLKFYKTSDYVLNYKHFDRNISTIIKDESKKLN